MDLVRAGLGMNMVLLGHKTGSIFIKRKGAKIDNIKDFKGLTVIIPYQMSVHYMLLHQLLTQGGLVPHVDVKFETLAPAQMPEALEYGEEDGVGGFIVAEPYGSYSIKMGFGDVFALSKDLWPKHPCCIFMLKEDLIKNHPDAVQEVVTSLVASGKLKSTNVDSAAEIGAAFLAQDKDLIKGVLSTPPDRIITEELLPRIEDFDKMQNYMVDQMKILKGKIDLEKFIDTRFAKAAGAT
jgi:NitT/TauT family transport system substrate-binding protein